MFKIVGIEKVNYTAKDGHVVNGTRLYLTYEDKNIDGYGTDSIYCGDKIPLMGLAVGDTIEVHYNKYGKVSKVEIM